MILPAGGGHSSGAITKPQTDGLRTMSRGWQGEGGGRGASQREKREGNDNVMEDWMCKDIFNLG